MESSEQLVNKVLTSSYTSFVSVSFGKNMPDSCTALGCLNWSTTSLQLYPIPSTKRYPEQTIKKWVNAKNDWLRTHVCKVNMMHVCICSAHSHFAADKASYTMRSFQKHEFFFQFHVPANKNLC